MNMQVKISSRNDRLRITITDSILTALACHQCWRNGAVLVEKDDTLSVSALSSSPTMPAAATTRAATPARAADGDFKAPAQGHAVKDSDGDYKPSGAPASAAATSSSAVLAAVTGLKKGG